MLKVTTTLSPAVFFAVSLDYDPQHERMALREANGNMQFFRVQYLRSVVPADPDEYSSLN